MGLDEEWLARIREGGGESGCPVHKSKKTSGGEIKKRGHGK